MLLLILIFMVQFILGQVNRHPLTIFGRVLTKPMVLRSACQCSRTPLSVIYQQWAQVKLQIMEADFPLNVIYKVVAKIIAKRLRPLLDTIISPLQEAFVSGRQILDNLVVAQELIHSICVHKKADGLDHLPSQ